MNADVKQEFGKRLRLRVCGIYLHENKILLIEHRGLNESQSFWLPPGGGVEYGESIEEALKREFLEETGLAISKTEFLYVYQYRRPPLHAVELFFRVYTHSNHYVLGHDPELAADKQIMNDIKFVTLDELEVMPLENKHELLGNLKSWQDLLFKSGIQGK